MRLEKIKNIRSKLKGNDACIGTWQQIPHASISEILGQAGFDWVAIDLEHGAIDNHQLPDLFRAIELGGTLPLARIAESKPKNCKSALDAGAGGIIAPMITNSDQLKMVRSACSWPPVGDRGVGFSRANLFGKNFDSYLNEARAPLLVAQIENILAVDNISEILAIEGLDAILIGPYDLSASMNITAEFENPLFVQTMKKIINACRDFKIPCGYHVVKQDVKLLEQKIKDGYQFIAYSIDAVCLQELKPPENIN